MSHVDANLTPSGYRPHDKRDNRLSTMGLHGRHTHGRVFRGLEAKSLLEMRKRDSHGDHVKMHIPEGFEEKQQADHSNQSGEHIKMNIPEGFARKQVQQQDDNGVATAYTVKYVTVEPTFEVTGPVVYSTITDERDLPTQVAQSAARTTAVAADEESIATAAASVNSDEAAYAAAKSAAQNRGSSATASDVSATATQTVAAVASTSEEASSVSPMTTLATSSSAPTTTFEGHDGHVVGGGGGAVRATHSTSSTPDAEISKDGQGMSGGAQAGLAIGIIALFALIGLGVFFLIRRRKSKAGQQQQDEMTNEKPPGFVVGGNGQLTAAPQTKTRFSADSDTAPSVRTTATAPRLSLRPVTQFLPGFGTIDANKSSTNLSEPTEKPTTRENPFGDAAVLSEKQAAPSATSPSNNPFDEQQQQRPATAHSKAASSSSSSSQASQPSTPAHLATAAAVPVAAAAAASQQPPRPTGPNNVHRVQLDFKPTMDDELGLKSGDLVRMLHEYDDGWALCVRMDRTMQGVGAYFLIPYPRKKRGRTHFFRT